RFPPGRIFPTAPSCCGSRPPAHRSRGPPMPDSSSNLILYPVFAMFALVVGVFLRLAQLRFAAVRGGTMDPTFYRLYQGGEEPEHIRVLTRHFINLFEMPLMFYVVVILTFI